MPEAQPARIIETFAEQLHHLVAGYFLAMLMDTNAEHKDRDFALFYLVNYRKMFPVTGAYYMPEDFLDQYARAIGGTE